MFTNLLQLFDALKIEKRTEDRRLKFDVFVARQSYKRSSIIGVRDIWGADLPVDGSATIEDGGVLEEIVQNGIMERNAERWTDRFSIDAQVRETSSVL